MRVIMSDLGETEGFIPQKRSSNFDGNGRNKNTRAIGKVISMAANQDAIRDIYGNRINSPTILSVVINEVEKRAGRYGEGRLGGIISKHIKMTIRKLACQMLTVFSPPRIIMIL